MLIFPLLLALQAGTAPRDSLSLADALAVARARRGAVAALAAQVDERRAQRRLASRPGNPVAEYSTVDVAPERRLVVTQPFSAFVRLPLERASASRLVEAAQADSAQRLALLERDVTRAYFGVVAAERRVQLVVELAAIADTLAILAGRRATAGDISELDRTQFVLEAARARLQLSRAVEARAGRRAALARELALDGDSLAILSEPLLAGLAGRHDEAHQSVAQLPEVQRARAVALSASLSERSLRWARLPIPSLLVQRDWSRTPGIPSSTRLGLAVALPLFSQGNEALDAAAARARAADAQAREVSLEVARAVAESRARVEESAHRARLATDSLVPAATALRAGAVRLYDAGRTSVLQVLEALRAERDAQLAAIDELLAFQEARADLAALAGRPLPDRR